MIQRIVVGDEMLLGVESQEKAEGDETIDRDRSSSSISREEMLHHLRRAT